LDAEQSQLRIARSAANPLWRKSRITVEVELTPNRKRQTVQGVMPSAERRTTTPNTLIC
tara:strand:+ start:425 stop:601 length:177 start_codon:yes stop_codon:yes gene_type:complete